MKTHLLLFAFATAHTTFSIFDNIGKDGHGAIAYAIIAAGLFISSGISFHREG